MIGDTPQPADTPRSEDDPWSFGDPDAAWWRGETDRAAGDSDRPRNPRRRTPQHQSAAGTLLPPGAARTGQYTGEAAEAHAAAARDVAEELDPDRARKTAVERDHDQPDPHRYDPLRPAAGHTARVSADTVAADKPADKPAGKPAGKPTAAEPAGKPTAAEQADKPTVEQAAAEPAAKEQATPDVVIEPDVMVLPEPSTRNRPTVPLERSTVPGQRPTEPLARPAEPLARPTEPLPRPTGSPSVDARLEKLENSPFWQDRPEDTAEEPTDAAGAHSAVRNHRSRPLPGRLPVSAHVSLVALGLLAAFFGWVSAEPFWLAAGHGDAGTATVTQCTGSGVTQRCSGRFSSADGRYTIARVVLLGVAPGDRAPGSTAPARMVSPDSRQAYLGSTGPLLHLRWVLGFALVLLCGYAVAGLTGARRLENGRARRGAVLLSLAGPLVLLAGFLIAAY